MPFEQGRGFVHKALMARRRQIIGDCVQLSFDAEHFNSSHPKEEPINVPLDFSEDVDERKIGEEAIGPTMPDA